jgi:hypothetical protein
MAGRRRHPGLISAGGLPNLGVGRRRFLVPRPAAQTVTLPLSSGPAVFSPGRVFCFGNPLPMVRAGRFFPFLAKMLRYAAKQ